MVRCFITGGTGFVGFHLVKLLCENNHDVTVMRRNNSSTELIDSYNVSYTIGDITDADSIVEALPDDTDWFFHNAARMAPWGSKKRFWPQNVDGTFNALEAARKKDIPTFVHTSSAVIYGFPNKEVPIKEDHPTNPIGTYSKSKLAAEKVVRDFSSEYGIKATIVRPAFVCGYGDGAAGPIMVDWMKTGKWIYIGNGQTIMSYTHAEDAARCLINAAENINIAQGNAYNAISFRTELRNFTMEVARNLGLNDEKFRSIPYPLALGLAKTTCGLYRAFHRKNAPMDVFTPFFVKLMGTHFSIDGTKSKEDLGFEPKWELNSTAMDVAEWNGEYKHR